MAQAYKRLGTITATAAGSPAGSTANLLHTCTGIASIASTTVVCNTSGSSATYRVCVSASTSFPTGSGANAYDGYLAYDGTVNANDSVFLTIGVTLDATNKYLLVSASSASVSFSAFGVEIS